MTTAGCDPLFTAPCCRFEQATSLLPAYCDNCGKQVFGANCYRCVSCKLVSHKVT